MSEVIDQDEHVIECSYCFRDAVVILPSGRQACEKQACIEDRPEKDDPRVRKCMKCNNEFDPYFKKYGNVSDCNTCGKLTDDTKGTVEIGGRVHYPHKTTGEIHFAPLTEIQAYKKKTDRSGGQGIIRGMSTQR